MGGWQSCRTVETIMKTNIALSVCGGVFTGRAGAIQRHVRSGLGHESGRNQGRHPGLGHHLRSRPSSRPTAPGISLTSRGFRRQRCGEAGRTRADAGRRGSSHLDRQAHRRCARSPQRNQDRERRLNRRCGRTWRSRVLKSLPCISNSRLQEARGWRRPRNQCHGNVRDFAGPSVARKQAVK